MANIKDGNIPKQQMVNQCISRKVINQIINQVGSNDKNVFSKLEKNVKPIYSKFLIEFLIELDEMDSCDPGIKILSMDKETFEDYILWWEDDNVEFIIIIDGSKVWNSTNICYVKNKYTGEVERGLIVDSSVGYIRREVQIEEIKNYNIPNILQGCSGPIYELSHYSEIRPIIKNDVGEDLKDYPDPKDWTAYYYDWSHLNWFIKNVFKNGLANIAIIL